ncbi:MAG: ATP-binding cassette domain-containing protein, partial [Nitrosopumilus sp.]
MHHYTRRIGQQNYYLWRQLELSKVLEINNLSKIYGEGESKVKALDNVSLSIEQGEVVLIVGSSGSGKSTLLNMIGLLDRPTNGKIFIDGIDTTTLNDDKISS